MTFQAKRRKNILILKKNLVVIFCNIKSFKYYFLSQKKKNKKYGVKLKKWTNCSATVKLKQKVIV